MIGRFFHTPGTRQFGFKPRFFDPDKEERDDREKRIKGEMGIVEEKVDDGKPFISNLKGQFRDGDGWQAKSSPGARKSQNRRLIMLIMILTLVFYLLLFR
jgi:hypothetical protein